ncbi:MAG: MogA/MoaB family molybdenum cofactor biosynthesis protein [Acidobacteria bacterium]|jgi:molybdenum cofactor synthesis domain-containing protein|nr:MogA/MoaB family molybdenum cofactor biosynthesis protein [Acidobacteriota bacterium]
MLEIAVITISDRAFRGEYRDLSGPTIVELINESHIEAEVSLTIVPDEKVQIEKAIQQNIGKDYIFTNGGTGISPRDLTPEITRSICDKELPGISEMLRRESFKETPFAIFSRGYAGLKNNTIIINFPGSVKAVTLCTKLLLPVLAHGKEMLQGGKHDS